MESNGGQLTTAPDWLPAIISMDQFGNNWERFLEAIYQVFTRAFIDNTVSFEGEQIRLKKHPVERGKEATFWHLISSGKDEDERTPDMRRCERIAWPRPIIENSDDPAIKIWENERRSEKRVVIWFEDVEYAVILAKRRNYVLLWTAYLVTRSHQKNKFRREYEKFKRAQNN